VGIVDAREHAAAFTGEDCHDSAGSLIGEHYAIQGNILAGRQVVEAIASAYEASDDDLAGDCWRHWTRVRKREEIPEASSRRPSS
jgi:uncharacterized Ntn-hydrolase superfamily protein